MARRTPETAGRLGYVAPVGRIAVLASGSGTILQAMLDADLPIVLVVVDRPCAAIDVAEAAGVPAAIVERTDFSKRFDRVAYTHDVVDALREHDVDLIAMAGFGTILEKPVHDAFPDRIVNTHPALLPAFKGWHAVEEALAAGVKVTGCTVHLARLEVDDGPILAQEAVPGARRRHRRDVARADQGGRAPDLSRGAPAIVDDDARRRSRTHREGIDARAALRVGQVGRRRLRPWAPRARVGAGVVGGHRHRASPTPASP